MTILDDHTVAVDTFSELKSVLEGNNTYTTVHLAADITMTAGIAIRASKQQVTIDGLYPLDGTGVVHTLTEYSSASTTGTLGVRSASSIAMTVRNMHIVGQNYYGILYVPESSSYAGVVITYENITYVGPQITYNPNGKTRYIDCDITLRAAYSANNEVGEVHTVEIGGTCRFTQPSTTYPIFWFRGSTAPALTILPGADVTISAGTDVMYTSNPVTLTVGEGADFAITARTTICRNASYRFAAVTVERDATFTFTQSASNGYASLYCNGAFTVNEGASVVMRAEYASARPLLYFYDNGTGDSLILNNPKNFALYSTSGIAMNFSGTTNVTVTAQQLNEWSTATPSARAGGLDDIPQYTWRKADGSAVQLAATVQQTSTTITSHNFTDAELASLPSLVYLLFGAARTISAGDLPLTLDPVVSDGGPISGTTRPGANLAVDYTVDGVAYSLTGTADTSGTFALATSGVIPIGTVLTIRANIPFLITTVAANAEEAGELSFIEVPGEVVFILRPIARNPVLFGRENPGWTLRIRDTRARGGPVLVYAEAAGPLTGDNPAHTLPGSLIHRSEAGAITVLDSTPTQVYAGVSEPGGGEIAVFWPADAGPLLRAVAEPFYTGERYTAPITWTLSEGITNA